MTTKWWIKGIVIIWIVNSILMAGCQPHLGNYQPISGVDEKINSLGRAIAQYQRDEVWTGGNEYSGAYTWDDLDNFHSKGGANKIVDEAREDAIILEGVVALSQLPVIKQDELLADWSEPIDPTWAQSGAIGKGTTEAGQIAEQEIATALVELVKDMLLSIGE